jgi:hypothetical protein
VSNNSWCQGRNFPGGSRLIRFMTVEKRLALSWDGTGLTL